MHLISRPVHHSENSPLSVPDLVALASRAGLCLAILIAVLTGGVSHASTPDDLTRLRQMAQLSEYIGVDYGEAVAAGQVINAEEYREMEEFSALLVSRSRDLARTDDDFRPLVAKAQALQDAVANKAEPGAIRRLGADLRSAVLAQLPELTLPQSLLSRADTATLFQSQCSGCHGMSGRGDGPLAASLEPPPTDFTDRARAENRSLLGLFDAISNGIDDTAMSAFPHLTEQQRWSLAFYAGDLAFQDAPAPAGDHAAVSLQTMVNLSPARLRQELPDAQRPSVDWLRANPGPLFATSPAPLAISRARLEAAREAYDRGDYAQANSLAVSAYLDGFELVENNLDAHDGKLRRAIEASMMQLRQLFAAPHRAAELDQAMALTLEQLDAADRLLGEEVLSNAALLSASLVILLREGLEALLVVIALTTVLIRTGRRDALKFVHLGWIGALVAGGATWAVAQSVITISGADRELMEGAAAAVAAAVLIYVGIWMHSKTSAAHWQAYIERHIQAHLTAGTLWGIAALAFIAVYREVFETVLFYQSLLTQAVSTQYAAVGTGFGIAVAILAVMTWLILRYSVKLPIGRFFAVTTYVLLALSFVLAGKAVMAFQEADLLAISPLPVDFEIDWIGLKSTWQGILAQGAILMIFMVFVIRSRVTRMPLAVDGEKS